MFPKEPGPFIDKSRSERVASCHIRVAAEVMEAQAAYEYKPVQVSM